MSKPRCILEIVGEYKPGDPPPTGYMDWHEWARIQGKAGLKQDRCGRCQRFKFPQEIARYEEREFTTYPTEKDAKAGTNGMTHIEKVPVCLECATKQPELLKDEG